MPKQKDYSTESSYHGNPNLKPVGHRYQYSTEEIEEIKKCRADPIYFIETYCKIIDLDGGLVPFTLWDFQKELIPFILNNRMTVLMMPRQQSKTQISMACILHYTLFNNDKTVAILANKGASAREALSRYQIMYENLPIWLQQGVKTWNKGDIELENLCRIFTAATTLSGIRGKSINWLYIDEHALIPNNIADEFFKSVYPTISAGKTTKMTITSTPIGYNHFWKFWNEALQDVNEKGEGKNGFVAKSVPWWKHPRRDKAWADEQRKLLGDVGFAQEVECSFLGSSHTLINAQTLENLFSKTPLNKATDPNNPLSDVDFYEEPIPGFIYMLIVDTSKGVGGDYSAFTVIDVTQTPYKLVAKYRNNKISPLLFPNIIYKIATMYNNAMVLVEINDSSQVADILFSDLEYENMISTISENGKTFVSPGFAKTANIGLRSNKATKRQGCFAIKSLLEEGKLLLFDADIIGELSVFIEKAGSYQADEGKHDDLVMTLVMFGWLSTNEYFKELTDIDIRQKLYHRQIEQIERDMTPFGFITGSLDEDMIITEREIWTPF